MSDEELADCLQQLTQAMQPFIDAVAAAWQQIMEHATAVVSELVRWYWREMHPILARYGLVPIARSSMMQRKIRRYALAYSSYR